MDIEAQLPQPDVMHGRRVFMRPGDHLKSSVDANLERQRYISIDHMVLETRYASAALPVSSITSISSGDLFHRITVSILISYRYLPDAPILYHREIETVLSKRRVCLNARSPHPGNGYSGILPLKLVRQPDSSAETLLLPSGLDFHESYPRRSAARSKSICEGLEWTVAAPDVEAIQEAPHVSLYCRSSPLFLRHIVTVCETSQDPVKVIASHLWSRFSSHSSLNNPHLPCLAFSLRDIRRAGFSQARVRELCGKKGKTLVDRLDLIISLSRKIEPRPSHPYKGSRQHSSVPLVREIRSHGGGLCFEVVGRNLEKLEQPPRKFPPRLPLACIIGSHAAQSSPPACIFALRRRSANALRERLSTIAEDWTCSRRCNAPMYSATNGMTAGGTINPAALSSGKCALRSSIDMIESSSFRLHDMRDPSESDVDFSIVRASLTAKGALSNPATAITPDPSPRGTKRSRSPDTYSDLPHGEALGDDGDSKPRKRGRPMKPSRGSGGVPESPNQSSMPLSSQGVPPQTPQSQTTSIPPQINTVTPTQASPPKSTPTKSVIKALPTVRDHTTDQLGAEGDEYIPREYDEAGEKKVTATGHLLENREYKCRTFFVPNRGEKLFMLATECARVLGYRDSYLLFNKNRSLYKIIATQTEKEDLINQEILPFSYRSRQIAIVTAKSMFRQFGSRVIVNGRRVRDDYWESKARKQGFTEEDLAGEKRPGAAKARDAAAAAEASATASMNMAHHGDIVYSNNPGHFNVHPQPQVQSSMMGTTGNSAPLPMITLAPDQPDLRLRDYSNIQRPRQEISGQPAYTDRIQTSPPTELMTQAHQTADYNKQINVQRDQSKAFLQSHWRQPREVPQSNIAPQPTGTNDGLPSTQVLQSPRTTQSIVQQPAMSHQGPQHMMQAQPYSQSSHQQNPIAQTPLRGTPQSSIRSDQMHGRSPGLPSQAVNPYAYQPQNQMWTPGQSQQSPPQHQQPFPPYSSHGNQQSPQIQQSPHQPPPQLRHTGSNPQMQPTLQYSGMQGLGQGYPTPGRGLYQPDQGSQQFMQQTTSAPQPGAQGWASQQPPGSGGSWGWTGQPQ
ncbi:hypothetical protein B7494_g7498 [Chlorociboria aeruginascens]|nr:hypothetical protein B7494_g7498 [Chlorociboria aeruginascens]